jgi:cytochrome c biogenesis protein CcmG, thiol:disulfide interchange protein DsbE
MGALTLGPIVLSLDRAYAGLGFLVLLVGAELLARRGRPELARWAHHAALAAFLGARAGFVMANADYYLGAPAAIAMVWQGGFAPWWGVAAAALVTILHARRMATVRALAPTLGLTALAAWWLPSAVLAPAVGHDALRMPAAALERLVGGRVELAELGQPAIVNVWATWCPPCRRELPVFFDAASAAPDVRILLVNQREHADVVLRYLARAGLPHDGVLLDPDGAVGRALRVVGLPTTFAFDADGRLVDVHVGELSAPALRALVASLR